MAKNLSPHAKLLLRAIRKGDVSAFFAFGDYLEEQGVEDRVLSGWRYLLKETRFFYEQRVYAGWDGDMVDVYRSILREYFATITSHYRLGWRIGMPWPELPKYWEPYKKFNSFMQPFIAAMLKFNKAKIQNQQR